MSGFVLDAKPEDRLTELARLESELRKLIDTAKAEKRRREKEVVALTELLGRQVDSIRNLKSPHTKVVVLREFKTLRLAVNLNITNREHAQEMVRTATRLISQHEATLTGITEARETLAKQVASHGKVLQFPTREVRRGRRT